MEFFGIEYYLLEFTAIWYIYQDLVQRKVKKYYFPFLLLLSIVFLVLIPVNAFLPLWLTFFLLSLLEKEARTICRHLFYSGLSVVLFDLFLRCFYIFVFPVLLRGIAFPPYLKPLGIVLIFPFLILITKALRRLFRIDYPTILKMPDKLVQRYIYAMNGLFFLYYIIHYTVFLKNPSVMANYDRVTLFASVMVLVYVLTLLNRKAGELHVSNVEREEKQYLENLEQYSQHLEGIYQNIRSFKHDYDNILISLNESIYHGDIDEIRRSFAEVLKKSQDRMEDEDYLFYQLMPIANNHIKLIVTKDLLEAKHSGIQVSVSLADSEDVPMLNQKDAITLLHNMLQLGIHHAKLSKKPTLRLVVKKVENGFEASVSYSTSVEKLVSSCLQFDSQSPHLDDHTSTASKTIREIFQRNLNISMAFESGSYMAKDTLIINSYEQEGV
ncbi:hypothetical protein [Streptococcus thoraltensis]|uniref:hypothetical protein n=1 Tax=Streptococcus thoraltensis TaxID=55085 RepID=UPI002A7F6CA8|nr:hypothetical protein [Streptococcus thoraltensis]MDY4761797.1 hypothetical protein [Streptococcus thoraltensis]